jgi:CBS domain-containing protein
MAMMVDGRFRHLPIVDGGRVVGLVSMRDLMAWTALRLRQGPLDGSDVDPAELLATIHRMRTGAA